MLDRLRREMVWAMVYALTFREEFERMASMHSVFARDGAGHSVAVRCASDAVTRAKQAADAAIAF